METSKGAEGSIDFRRLPDIERLPPPYQVQLLSQARVQRCPDGQVLFNAGDVDDCCLYLLDGMVILIGNDGSVREVRGNEADARLALDGTQPHRCSARAVGSATVLQVKRSLLEKLTAQASVQSARESELAETTHGDPGNWMTRIARAPIFAKLPSSNLLMLFERGTLVNVDAGEVVVSQGSSPGSFFVIQEGAFRLERASADGSITDLVELHPGDSVGAEAILTERPLDASVVATTPGSLVRISSEDFLKLMAEPLLQAVPLKQAGELVRTHRARWLDVRPAQMAADIKGEHALHIPLDLLRMRIGRLPRQTPYIVTSDNSACSRAGVFLLLDAGYEARYLTDVAAVTAVTERPEPPSADITEPVRPAVRQEPIAAERAAAPGPAEPAGEAAASDVYSPSTTPETEPAVTGNAPATPPGPPLAELAARIRREIDAQTTALKERVEHELAEHARLLEQHVQDELRRKRAEIEARYQLMAVRKEQLLRKSYERVLALANSTRQQFDHLQSAQNGFQQLLGQGIDAVSPEQEFEQTSGGESA